MINTLVGGGIPVSPMVPGLPLVAMMVVVKMMGDPESDVG